MWLPTSGALDAEDRLGQRRLARAGLADKAERLAVAQLEVDLDEGRDVVAGLVEGLGDLRACVRRGARARDR